MVGSPIVRNTFILEAEILAEVGDGNYELIVQTRLFDAMKDGPAALQTQVYLNYKGDRLCIEAQPAWDITINERGLESYTRTNHQRKVDEIIANLPRYHYWIKDAIAKEKRDLGIMDLPEETDSHSDSVLEVEAV